MVLQDSKWRPLVWVEPKITWGKIRAEPPILPILDFCLNVFIAKNMISK